MAKLRFEQLSYIINVKSFNLKYISIQTYPKSPHFGTNVENFLLEPFLCHICLKAKDLILHPPLVVELHGGRGWL